MYIVFESSVALLGKISWVPGNSSILENGFLNASNLKMKGIEDILKSSYQVGYCLFEG